MHKMIAHLPQKIQDQIQEAWTVLKDLLDANDLDPAEFVKGYGAPEMESEMEDMMPDEEDDSEEKAPDKKKVGFAVAILKKRMGKME